jgi:hypothetical protein
VEIDGTPQTGPSFPGMTAYAKDAIPVQATAQDQPFDVKVDWQDTPLHGNPGDYLVSDGNSQWVVAKDIFHDTYSPLDDGTFVKTATVDAVQMQTPFTVNSLEGAVSGKPGDYLLQGPKGESWIVKQDAFLSTYHPVTAPSNGQPA